MKWKHERFSIHAKGARKREQRIDTTNRKQLEI